MVWPFTSSSSASPSPPPVVDEAAAAGCPVDHSTRSKWIAQNSSVEGREAPHPFLAARSAPPASAPAAGRALSTEREVSSIPRFLSTSSSPSVAATTVSVAVATDAPSCPVSSTSPSGPPEASTSGSAPSNWVYPSPSQFYNALERKNRNPKGEDMDIVVPIHNAVNERTWAEVLKWENESGAGLQKEKHDVQLVSFKGRPQDRTPRAWFKTLLGYQPPFDRHDWIIDRNGKRIRYIIDFYTGRGAATAGSGGLGLPPSLAFYLDVRPALDDFETVRMRVRRSLNRLFGLSSGMEQASKPEQLKH